MLDTGHQHASRSRRSAHHLLLALVSTALFAFGCGTAVIGGGGGAGGTGGAASGTGVTDWDMGSAGTGTPPVPVCTGAVGEMCEYVYPAPGPSGETCLACSCRCCEQAPEMPACLADAACAAWLACLRTCEYGMPCDEICGVACTTGGEPACYLSDCHNWSCGGACGQST